MNPRAGDTVTSTKSTTSKTKITNTNTTEELNRHSSIESNTKSTGAITRKRRQQAEEQAVTTQPPVKSRRQAETERTTSKSRIGDFFSNLAIRIRGPKNADNSRECFSCDEYEEFESKDTIKQNEEMIEETESEISGKRENKRRCTYVKVTTSSENKDTTSTESSSSTNLKLNFRPSFRPSRKDDTTRLRKTIQWLEEGARRLREDLANARSELHEERKAAKLARREFDAAIREAKNSEATKYATLVSDLKTRLAQISSTLTAETLPNSSKSDQLRDDNHRRETATLKKRLAEAEMEIQKLKTNSLDRGRAKKKSNDNSSSKTQNLEVRKLQVEIQTLRSVNRKLEEKLQIAEESARARANELRAQHESHEADLAALQKALRSDTIKMIDEIQSKNRTIEKLEKLVNAGVQENQKLRTKKDETMRKLRESERSHHIRLAPRIEEKIHHDDHVVDLCKVECEDDVGATELDRLRELAVEQQEVIEVLRQAVKEKERKLEQLSNKRRKEEFYKQWLELEPVVEVDDEDEQQQEEGDSALSSAPSSLSPQPGVGRVNGNNAGITREAYESMLLEIEELQTKLLEEQQELTHARSQVRDLEKALLQETRGSQTSRRALSEKLRDAEEREARLVAEISELREQNELLEFRVLELEESPNLRDTPDPADSGIVSPEPIHLYKDHQANKHRDRAVATVIPYTSSYNSNPVLPSDPQKAPLSLQESGIFEGEDVENEGVEDHVDDTPIPVSSQSTQTEAPAGELLQEVQRLQELRARIQERALKVPPVSPVSDRKSESPCEFALDVGPLRERIRELEDRVTSHETERNLSKQREEELLDENYRLTEKTYWLESELKNVLDKLNVVRLTNDAETMTDASSIDKEEVKLEKIESDKVSSIQRCQKIYTTAIKNLDVQDGPSNEKSTYNTTDTMMPSDQPCPECSDLWKSCDARIRNLARTEFCLRQQIASLEHRESAFFETLRQADATWAKLEADYETKQRDMTERLNAQVELNRALFEHLTRLNTTVDDTLDTEPKSRPEEPMDVDDNVQANKLDFTKSTQTDEVEGCKCVSLSRSSSSATGTIVRADATRVSTISRTSIILNSSGCDEIDNNNSLPIGANDPPTEVATEAKEEEDTQSPNESEDQEDQLETIVGIDESSSDKKVSRVTILRGSLRRYAKGSDPLSTWNARRKAISFERNVFSSQRTHRLTLYQEICV